MLLSCRTFTRPYTSDKGPKNNGPIAYESTKIDKIIADLKSVPIPRSRFIFSRAGATMDEETGDINVKDETTNTAAHFRLNDQFFGFPGSSGPSQVTRLGSFSLFGDSPFSDRDCISTSRSVSMPAIASWTGCSSSCSAYFSESFSCFFASRPSLTESEASEAGLL